MYEPNDGIGYCAMTSSGYNMTVNMICAVFLWLTQDQAYQHSILGGEETHNTLPLLEVLLVVIIVRGDSHKLPELP